MTNILYKEDLDVMKCACKDCDKPGIFLASKCHIQSPLLAKYLADEGVLSIMCYECGMEVVKVAVAGKEKMESMPDVVLAVHLIEHGYQATTYVNGINRGTECRDFGGNHPVQEMAHDLAIKEIPDMLAHFRDGK